MTRSLAKRLEWIFRHTIVYPVLRLIFRNRNHDEVIDLRSIKRLLILRYDRIGDMIVTTPLFRKLKEINPNLEIGVLASPANVHIIKFNPTIDHIHILHRNWWKLLQTIRRARGMQYDVVLNFIFNRTTTAGLLANLIGPHSIKVGQGDEKYRFYFNKLLSLTRGSLHMTEVLAEYCSQTFGIPFDLDGIRFDIATTAEDERRVKSFLQRHNLWRGSEPLPFVVMNVSAKEEYRKITEAQCDAILRVLTHEFHYPVIIIAAPEETAVRQRIVHGAQGSQVCGFPETGHSTFHEIAVLIRHAVFVVTPDTSIVHVASAAGKPVIGFYVVEYQDEWLPYRIPYRILRAQPGSRVGDIRVKDIQEFLRSSIKELLAETHP